MSTKIYTTTKTLSQDQRVAVEGDVQTLVAPGAALGGPGTISAAPGSAVNQTVSVTGFGGNVVTEMLANVLEDASRARESMGELASVAIAASSSQQAGLTGLVKATQAPEQAALASISPLIIVGVIFVLLWVAK